MSKGTLTVGLLVLIVAACAQGGHAKSHVSGEKVYFKTHTSHLGTKYVTCQWEHTHDRHWIVLADFEEAVPFIITHDVRVTHKKGKLKYKDPIMLSCMHGEYVGLKDLKSFLAAGPNFKINSWTMTYKGDVSSTEPVQTGDEIQLEIFVKDAIGTQRFQVFSTHAANFDPGRRTMTSVRVGQHVLKDSTLIVEFASDRERKPDKSEL